MKPSSWAGIDLKRALVRLAALTVVLALAETASADTWWNTAWNARRKITINNSGQNQNLLDVPVLVRLDSTRVNYAKTQNAGQDIRFVDSNDVTVLAHEIELWNEGPGSSYVWVRIPQIDASSSTDFFYMYYDNPGAADGQNVTGVWDTSFKMVQHLNETAGAHTDSTSNANNSVVVNVTTQGSAVGQIDGSDTFTPAVCGPGSEFDPACKNIDVADNATLDVGAGESITAEAWIKTSSTGNYQFVVNKKTNTADWQLHVNSSNDAEFWVTDGPNSAHPIGTAFVTDGNWHYLVGRWDGSAFKAEIFVDGVSTASATNPAVVSMVNSQPLVIGEEGDASPPATARGYNFNGTIDEVRVSKAARSNNWIRAQNLSMRDQFLFFEGETGETCGGSTGSCNLRSIGTRVNYGTAQPEGAGTTVTATLGSRVVTGSAGTNWIAANRGAGDRINIAGVDYTVLFVDSATQLRLTSNYTGATGGGKTYVIARQYATLTLWEDCIDGPPGVACAFFPVTSNSLVADNRGEIGFAYDDTGYPGYPFAERLNIEGSVTDAAHTITLRGAYGNRHYGLPGTGVVIDNSAGGAPAVRVNDEFVTLDWLEIRNGPAASDDGIQLGQTPITAANRLTISNCIVHNMAGDGIEIMDPDVVADLYNNIIYSTLRGISITANPLSGTSRVRMLNNTLYNNAGGGILAVNALNPTVLLQNNISDNGAAVDYNVGGENGGSSHNLASDATASTHSLPGTGLNSQTPAQISFVNAAAGNLHLNGGSTAVNAGTNLSGVFGGDIDAGTRTGPWDIGADESGAAGPPDYLATVYYSVGTSTANLRSSLSLTMTISSGTATFSEPQATNIGVGDKITYNGSTVAYISGRSSSTVYSVITAVGVPPPDVAGASVDSIRRAFNSLTAANSSSADPSHLNLAGPPYDLVAANVQLNWPCYNDGPMDDRPSVTGWTTGPAHYVRIYAPYGSAEVGASQRHRGVAGTGFRLAPVSGVLAVGALLGIDEEYVRVEGIEVDGSGLTNARGLNGIYSANTLSTTSDVRIEGNIVHDLHATVEPDAFDSGIHIDGGAGTGAAARISNNIVYDITSSTFHVIGIVVSSGTTSYVYNNTVYHIWQTWTGAANGAAWGISARNGGVSSIVNAKNNYAGDVFANVDVEFCYQATGAGPPTLNQTTNASSDGTGTPASLRNKSAYGSYFVNVTAGSENLHLLNDAFALWGSYGTDLDGDPNLPVAQDIDGGVRSPTQPDIGADEFGNMTDLAITKDDFQATEVPGTGVTYTITVANNGPAPVAGATVMDILPASLTGASWTCVPGGGASCTAGPVAGNINDTVNLPVGGNLTYTLTANIAPGAPTPLDNTATVTPPGGVSDPDSTNDSDTDSDMLTPQAELEIGKAVDTNPASLGQVIKYTLNGRNNGPSSASVTLLDDLPLEVAFDSATPPCSYSLALHRVTCALGTLGPGAPYSVDIFVRTVAGGMIRNEASVYSPAFDSNLSNNAAAVTSSVDVPTDAIRFFTVTSTSGRNRLEWVYPTGFNKVRILYNAGPTTCVFPVDPVPPGLDGTPIDPPAGTAGEKDFFDHLGVTDTWKYCYTIFVERSFDTDYGPGRSTAGRPFAPGLVKWAFSVGATALAPPGIGLNAVHTVAHDNGLHAMEKAGVVGEEGTWPPGWKPVGGSLPFSQGRPTTIASPVAGPARVVFLGSQDHSVYTINADAGDTPVQMSADLGEMVLAQPSGMFRAFGGDRDHIFVGTRKAPGEFYALEASNLSIVPGWPFSDGGGSHGKVGPILSQASVDYGPPRRVYFTSKPFNIAGPPDNRTVWCLELASPPTPPSVCWSQAIPNVATSPTIRGNRLYVGTSDGKVHALDLDNNGAPVWTITTGDGPVLGFVVVDRPTGDLYFATTNFVWGFLGDGSAKWGPLGSRPITRPSVPVMLVGTSRVYVGGDGVLHGLKASDGTEDAAFPIPLGDGTAKVGSVTIDTRATPRHLYVGTEAGVIYAVLIP